MGIIEILMGVIVNYVFEYGFSGFYFEVFYGLGLCILGLYLFEYIFDYVYECFVIVGREVFGVYESNDRKVVEFVVKKFCDF